MLRFFSNCFQCRIIGSNEYWLQLKQILMSISSIGTGTFKVATFFTIESIELEIMRHVKCSSRTSINEFNYVLSKMDEVGIQVGGTQLVEVYSNSF